MAVNGPVLHYRIEGEGSRVLLLHPVGLDLTFWDPVVAILRSNFTVLRVDLRGHGQSPMSPASKLEDFADDIHALIESLAFVPTAVVGLSFGGMLTQVLALKYPRDVNALVICGCPSTLDEQTRTIMHERATAAEKGGMAAIVDATLERWFTDIFRASGNTEHTRKRLLSDNVAGWVQAWRAIADLDTAPRLGAICVPTLCIAGEHDRGAPPEIVAAIAEKIPGARFVVMPGAAHMMQIEQPQAFAANVTNFLKEVLQGSN